MKKIYILLSLALAGLTANAQVTLTGTSYLQNFTDIGSGLPTGWFCYSAATSTSLGTANATWYPAATATYYDTSSALPCFKDVLSHGFKNSASADSANDTMSCSTQPAVLDRALSVRQASTTGYDPGASFVFEIANTLNLSNFNLAFELQSLDITSGRSVTWTVDYGLGATPTTFTPVTPAVILPLGGTMTTGGKQFTDDTIAISFGSALDNQSGPVWIRISALTASSGSGNRPTTAIDNFTLTYKSAVGIASLSTQTVGFKAIGIANSGNVNFTCNVAKSGQYSLNMYDITGRQICTKQVELTSGIQTTVSVNDKNLIAGMYIARITDGNAVGITKVIVQ
ncbi:MAG TPA: T9SS type A sorting domain-containing protein [Bacteroidia bacterium]|jgi:hypothetical protein|nr:T9SS type A sorting domain-containing protein [Bacteroidia bacterium]